MVKGFISIIKVGNSCPQALVQYSGDILGLRELVIDFWYYRFRLEIRLTPISESIIIYYFNNLNQ